MSLTAINDKKNCHWVHLIYIGVSIVHIFIPMRVSSFWKNIVNVQIWKPNMFLLLYIYFFPMRILNPNTKIKKEEPEAWMNICQLLFSYLMKIQWYKISLYRRKYMLTKKSSFHFIPFHSIWTILDHFGLLWTILDHFGPFHSILFHFIPFCHRSSS